jgi:hypothetical protein
MKNTDFAIDVIASGKDEMKKVRKYLRTKFKVGKRSDENIPLNYLGTSANGIDFEYYEETYREILTLPRDWDKLVEYTGGDAVSVKAVQGVEKRAFMEWAEKKVRQPKAGDWVFVIASSISYSFISRVERIESIVGDDIKVENIPYCTLSKFGESFRFATPEEIKDHLIKEAEKRGFKEGVEYNNIPVNYLKPSLQTLKIDKEWSYVKSYDAFGISGCGWIYAKGQWAEIIKKPAPKLENFCLIETRDHTIAIVLNKALITKYNRYYSRVERYNKDLIEKYKRSWDIIKVSKPLTGSNLCPKNWTLETLEANLLWER